VRENQKRYFTADQPSQRTRLTIRRSAGGAGLVAEIAVSPGTARRLRTQITEMRSLPDYDQQPTLYEMASEAMVGRAAPDLTAALRAIRQLDSKVPALIIVRGLQVDDRPVVTPLDGVFVQSVAAVEASVLIGAMRHYGLSGIAFGHENGGRLFRAVCPVAAQADMETSQGAAADLRAHTDNYHYPMALSNDTHPYRWPIVNAAQWFATVTPLEPVPMRVKLNDDVLRRLDPRGGDPRRLAGFEQLQRSEFRFRSPPSHGTVHRIEPLPVLVRLDDTRLGFGMRFHAGTMEGVTPQAQAALELLRHAWERTPEEVIVTQRGDLIGYDNRRVTHRREPYAARFDASDRFYLRVYGQPVEEVERWAALMGGGGRMM
jgi:hypothetical protein